MLMHIIVSGEHILRRKIFWIKSESEVKQKYLNKVCSSLWKFKRGLIIKRVWTNWSNWCKTLLESRLFDLLLRNQFNALKALADLEALSLSDPAILMFIDYLLTNRSSFQHARKRSAQDTNLRKENRKVTQKC